MSNNPPIWQPPGRPSATPPPPPPPQGPPLSGYALGAPPPNMPYPPGYAPASPPRPDSRVAALLMLVGALVITAGCFLPWLSGRGRDFNGFDDLTGSFDDEAASGYVFVFFAAILLAFGITTLAAKRLLPIMIIGIVVAAISLVGSLAEYSDYRDLAAFIDADTGAGLPVVILGSALALGGAIAGCAQRRRWPAR